MRRKSLGQIQAQEREEAVIKQVDLLEEEVARQQAKISKLLKPIRLRSIDS